LLALGLLATVLVNPSAALAASRNPGGPGTIDPGPANPGPVAPSGQPDLAAFLYQSNVDVQPGQAVYFSATIRNKGNASAAGFRTLVALDSHYTNVHVDSALGSTCTIQYESGGWLPGYWAVCDGGPLPAGQERIIRINAIAPSTPGPYATIAEADSQGTVAESNESNNSARVTLTVH